MNNYQSITASPEALAAFLGSRRLKRRGTMLFTGSIAPRARRRIATTAAARSGTIRYGGSASRRRR